MSTFDDPSSFTLSWEKRNRKDVESGGGGGIRLKGESFLRAWIHTPAS